MNKTTKGTIAVAAAIALLMGGAGSLAYWQDSAKIDAATVTTGQLDVNTDGCSWSVAHRNAAQPAPIADLASFRMVPGDTVTCDVEFSTVADGADLKADATIAWTGTSALPAGMQTKSSGTYGSNNLTDTTFAVAKGKTNGKLSFSLVWPYENSPQAGMSTSIDLAAATVTVTQK